MITNTDYKVSQTLAKIDSQIKLANSSARKATVAGARRYWAGRADAYNEIKQFIEKRWEIK